MIASFSNVCRELSSKVGLKVESLKHESIRDDGLVLYVLHSTDSKHRLDRTLENRNDCQTNVLCGGERTYSSIVVERFTWFRTGNRNELTARGGSSSGLLLLFISFIINTLEVNQSSPTSQFECRVHLRQSRRSPRRRRRAEYLSIGVYLEDFASFSD